MQDLLDELEGKKKTKPETGRRKLGTGQKQAEEEDEDGGGEDGEGEGEDASDGDDESETDTASRRSKRGGATAKAKKVEAAPGDAKRGAAAMRAVAARRTAKTSLSGSVNVARPTPACPPARPPRPCQ